MSERITTPAGELIWYGQEFLKHVEEEYVRKMLFRATAELERIVQEMIRSPKSGRVYRIPKSNVYYTASAPGEAPAVRSGRFRQSIRSVIVKTGPFEWQAIMGPTVKDYPGWLEDGTRTMKPRPLWAPALKVLQGKMSGILRLDRLP